MTYSRQLTKKKWRSIVSLQAGVKNKQASYLYRHRAEVMAEEIDKWQMPVYGHSLATMIELYVAWADGKWESLRVVCRNRRRRYAWRWRRRGVLSVGVRRIVENMKWHVLGRRMCVSCIIASSRL